MRRFKWKLDTSFIEAKADLPTPNQLFINYFYEALRSAFRDGLGKDYIRRQFNISNKIDAAKDDFIELEDAEFDLLKDAFNRAKFSPNMAKLAVQIYDAIEKAAEAEK